MAISEISRRSSIAHLVDPLHDSRWNALLESHPSSSIFHTVPWLEALRRTYGYEPIVVTMSPPGTDLSNGLVFCRIDSWLSGRRWVSLPFSDHCEPLVDDAASLQTMLSSVEQIVRQERALYLEIRPLRAVEASSDLFHSRHSYYFHQLDLTPDIDTLFRNCHKGSTQRKIRRAEREGLIYKDGQSESLLSDFYRLLFLTRKRHQLPPQPKRWFSNLIACFGDVLKIRVAFKGRQAVAAMLTIRYKNTLVYKYGGSDARFHNLGGMHLLFWKAIQEAKQEGLGVLDFGRSDCDNTGLTTFKDRWGGTRSVLTYSRFATTSNPRPLYEQEGWKVSIAKRILSHSPDRVLHSIGDLLYKHIG